MGKNNTPDKFYYKSRDIEAVVDLAILCEKVAETAGKCIDIDA